MTELLTTILAGPDPPDWDVSLVASDDNSHDHVLIQDKQTGIGFAGSVHALCRFGDSLVTAATNGALLIVQKEAGKSDSVST